MLIRHDPTSEAYWSQDFLDGQGLVVVASGNQRLGLHRALHRAVAASRRGRASDDSCATCYLIAATQQHSGQPSVCGSVGALLKPAFSVA